MGINFKTIGRKIRNTGRDIQRIANSNEVKRVVNSNLGQSLKGIGKAALHQAIADQHYNNTSDNPFAQAALNSIANSAHENVEGLGLRRKKRGNGLAKGSHEAKQHMARIRAMKYGGSIMPLG